MFKIMYHNHSRLISQHNLGGGYITISIQYKIFFRESQEQIIERMSALIEDEDIYMSSKKHEESGHNLDLNLLTIWFIQGPIYL